MTSQCTYMTT